MEINGASAVVTGGASGLGAATARTLADKGARVVILDRQEDAGKQIVAEIGGVFAFADVSDEQQVQAAIDVALDLAPLRVLVNCAGLGPATRIVDRDGTPIPLPDRQLQLRPPGSS